jgi:hypothetical protein
MPLCVRPTSVASWDDHGVTPDAEQRRAAEQWERLIEYLNTWCTVTAAEPGHIQVSLATSSGAERRASILMTPYQWDLMVGVMWGGFDDAAEEVRRNLLDLARSDRYLVFGAYELNPSPTPE